MVVADAISPTTDERSVRYNDEDWNTPRKKMRSGVSPHDFERGTVVLYGDGRRGIVQDAFVPLDEFWIVDEESGELVHNESGEVRPFKSAELQYVAASMRSPPTAPNDERPPGGNVLVIGTEPQMMQILQHFGSPDLMQRREPQQLLAIPCHMCDTKSLLVVASEGVDEGLQPLAQTLRPDINVALRAVHLAHAVEQLGPHVLRMDGYYVLSAVRLPYSQSNIEASHGWLRHWREVVCNQIDLCVTAGGHQEPDEMSPAAIARRALAETCGICIADRFWEESFQFRLRQDLGYDLPLKFTDPHDALVVALMIPSNAVIESEKGLLYFKENFVADMGENEGPEVQNDQAKTISQWDGEQAQFAHLPKLPPEWLRVKSRKSGDVYYFNKLTQETTFKSPLPSGWTMQKSKSTGRVYYFNAAKQLSQFDLPTE